MKSRIDYFKLSPQASNKLVELTLHLSKKPLLAELAHLIMLRASQLNGCAFCVDMHVKEAKIHGERELRLHHVAAWRESQLFSPVERAALEWAEALTQLPPHGIPESVYAKVREHFAEQDLSDLTFLIVAINGWNRLNVAFQTIPGSSDEAFGLTKANLN
ncbi:carboxymuconolactone decarboxylase family protein [Pseudomonas sp. JR33AA]|uniref:carboxymuconolactone decarboxylase family protein n=1 Tax=Pseudomonas sp. JR33AA TaxID=2899113 RepID=UPI001F31AEE4|nr:carboxymuconolactone decarboxylase family protein [Pseudomonas sp. JR33AA]MCE5977838.1 carboxymuconolactone decarboxylase family protein [Pseudomonas sp. JR33AA]